MPCVNRESDAVESKTSRADIVLQNYEMFRQVVIGKNGGHLVLRNAKICPRVVLENPLTGLRF